MRKPKLNRWQREAKRKREREHTLLKAANATLAQLLPFIPEFGRQNQTVVKAHDLIAGRLARFKVK